jgi:hypothetical protein
MMGGAFWTSRSHKEQLWSVKEGSFTQCLRPAYTLHFLDHRTDHKSESGYTLGRGISVSRRDGIGRQVSNFGIASGHGRPPQQCSFHLVHHVLPVFPAISF